MSLENNINKELEKTNSNINNVYFLYLEQLKNKQTMPPTYSSKLVAFITQEIKKYFTIIEQLERELEQESIDQLHKEWEVAAGGPPPPPPPPPGGMGVQNEDKKKLLQLILKLRENDNDIYLIIIKNVIEIINQPSKPLHQKYRNKYLKYKQKYLELKNNF